MGAGWIMWICCLREPLMLTLVAVFWGELRGELLMGELERREVSSRAATQGIFDPNDLSSEFSIRHIQLFVV